MKDKVLKNARMIGDNISAVILDAFEKGRKEAFEEVYNKMDEGVCHICEYYLEDHKCIKECNKHGWERKAIMKWLKEQKRC